MDTARTESISSIPISTVYRELLRNFDNQIVRLKQKFSNPAFDDTPLVRERKTLPKI